MMNFKLQSVLLVFIIVLFSACGNPPLTAPEKTNSEIGQVETVAKTDTENAQQGEALVVEPITKPTATLEIIGGSTNSPLPSSTVAPTETVVSPTPLPSPVTVMPTEVIASSTPASPTATVMPETTETIELPIQLTPTPSGGVSYSAEKISLVPVQLELEDLVIESTDSQINFGGWSNSGQKFHFGVTLPELLTDPTLPEGNNFYAYASEQWIANIDGTEARKIFDQTGTSIRWSPDDTQLAFYTTPGVNKRELQVIDLKTNISLKLNPPDGLDINNTDYYGDLEWLDTQHLLYPTYSNENRHLWVHNVQSDKAEMVIVDDVLGNSWANPHLAPNKRYVAGNTVNGNLWLGELVKDNGQFRLKYIKTVISEEGLFPIWSPDSAKLGLVSYGRFANILRVINLDTEKIVENSFVLPVAWVQWSPDSQVLIVSNRASGNSPVNDIYVTNADGSGLKLLSLATDTYLQWSPTGEYIAAKLVTEVASNNTLNIFRVEVNE
jgi:hypothetical protein